MDGRPLIARLRALRVVFPASLLALGALAAPALAQWNASSGLVISNAANAQSNPAMVADLSGGFFVAWYDTRSGAGADVYVRHVDATGALVGSELAITSDHSATSAPVATADGQGGVIVAWSGAQGALLAQHVSSANSVIWTAGGVRACTDNHSQLRAAITGDGAGGAILAWEDYRGSTVAIFAQSLASLNGARGWGDAAVAMDTSGTDDRLLPRIASDNASGAVVCWDDSGGVYHTEVRRILASGAVTWQAPVQIGGSNERKAMIACDASAGTYVCWNKPGSGTSGAWTERLDANGAVVTGWTAQLLDHTSATLAPCGLFPEASGGLLVLMSDASYIRAQELGSNGGALAASITLQPTPPPSFVITGATGAADGAGGLYAAWTEDDGESYARHLVSTSGPVRTAIKALTASGSTARVQPTAQTLTSGDLGVAWADINSDTNVVAQRMGPAGTLGAYQRVFTTVANAGANPGKIIKDPATVADSLNGTFYVAAGSSATFRARSNGGYHLDSLWVDTEFFGPAPNYTFTTMSADSSLRAAFSNAALARTVYTKALKYQSIGFAQATSTPSTLLGALWPPDDTKWKFGRWNPVARHYIEPPDSLTSVNPGEGYWLGTTNADTLPINGSAVPEANLTLSLFPAATADSGWNQIADPFRFPVVVSDLQVSAGGAPVGLTSGGNTYTDATVMSAPPTGTAIPVTVMHPDTAYWLWKLPGTGNVKLVFPYWFDPGVALTAPAPAPDGAWSIALDVSGDGDDAAHLELGASDGTPGADRALTHRAPPLGPAGGLALTASREGGAYASDFRVDAPVLTWDLALSGNGTLAERRLAFTFRNLPAGRTVTLSDPASGWSRTVGPGESVPLAIGPSSRALRLTVAAGAGAPAAGGPSALRAAAPNPFRDGVALVFWLPSAGGLGYEVFDLAGRRIAGDARASLAPGEHVLAWNGRDAAGSRVRPGVYLVRWRAADRSGVTRLVAIE